MSRCGVTRASNFLGFVWIDNWVKSHVLAGVHWASNPVVFWQPGARCSEPFCNLLGKADGRYLVRRQHLHHVNQHTQSAKPSNAFIFNWSANNRTSHSRDIFGCRWNVWISSWLFAYTSTQTFSFVFTSCRLWQPQWVNFVPSMLNKDLISEPTKDEVDPVSQKPPAYQPS